MRRFEKKSPGVTLALARPPVLCSVWDFHSQHTLLARRSYQQARLGIKKAPHRQASALRCHRRYDVEEQLVCEVKAPVEAQGVINRGGLDAARPDGLGVGLQRDGEKARVGEIREHTLLCVDASRHGTMSAKPELACWLSSNWLHRVNSSSDEAYVDGLRNAVPTLQRRRQI